MGYLIPDLSSLGPGDGSTVWSLLMVGRVVGSSYGEDLHWCCDFGHRPVGRCGKSVQTELDAVRFGEYPARCE